MGELNCQRCQYMHEDNRTCTETGGFCTAVSAARCHLLREYLDTGLTPEQCKNAKTIIESAFADDTSKAERIRELLKADKEGHIAVLPCKVGDTVWANLDGLKHTRVCVVDFISAGTPVTSIIFSPKYGLNERYCVSADAFGKTVFLTREEAEKALEARKDG